MSRENGELEGKEGIIFTPERRTVFHCKALNMEEYRRRFRNQNHEG